MLEKELSYFPKDNRCSFGYRNKCKKCTNEEQRIRRKNNLEKYKATRKIYYYKNIEKIRKEKKISNDKYKDSKALYDVQYRKKHKEKIAEYKKNWDKNQMKNNILYRIKKNLRRRVHHALKGNNKSKSTMKLIGCTPEFFKNYIESLFIEGMTWDNYGEWHIDHIIPCFTFDLTIPEEQNKCFNYSNQRPLWKTDNLKRPKNI
jgi:hypothetical protein